MRIGILSLPYTTNYGGILQALALQNLLEAMGYEVQLINFRRKHIEPKFKLWIYRLCNLLTGRIPLKRFFERKSNSLCRKGEDTESLLVKNKLFLDENLKYTQEVDEESISEVCQQFDCIVVGSDQVWSVTDGKYLPFFFDWKYTGRKIAYAGCSVNKKPSFLNISRISKLLADFDAISVRDNVTLSFCRSANKNLRYSLVVDPTFLYDFREYHTPTIYKCDYILTYILGDEIKNGNLYALSKLKQQFQCYKVIAVIIPSVSTIGKIGADITIENATPKEWINLIRHAKVVLTDSYHGVVFSIKYKKPFVGYYSLSYRATRLLDLKNRFRVNNIVDDFDNVKFNKNDDTYFDETELNKAINFSIEFINKSIE